MLREGEILLRPLALADQDSLMQLANNKKIWDNLRDYFSHPYSRQDAAFFIQQTQQEAPLMTFSIQYAADLCSIIGLVGQSDVYKKTAEIGYWLGEPFWQRGMLP